MIRALQNADIHRVAEIWLHTNIKAHYFIPAQYWKEKAEIVKDMMLQAEVCLYEDEQNIQGFIGVQGEYIAGIFVAPEMQSHGIGTRLLQYIKERKPALVLKVYQKNSRALSFYQREGFAIQCAETDTSTGEKEYVMKWMQK